MQEHSDTELVKQFQRGDSLAFAVFADRHRDRLFRLAMVWSADSASAEDAVQEAFARSYTGLLKFGFRAAPSTWLIRVCRNICLEMNRQTTREVRTDESLLDAARASVVQARTPRSTCPGNASPREAQARASPPP